MTPESLTAHAFELMQLVLLLIVFFGIYTLRAGERRLSRMHCVAGPAHRLRQPFAWFLLLSLGVLVFTRGMLLPRAVILRGASLPVIDVSLAFPLIFALDLLGAGLLVWATGGYSGSPFSPVLLVLPLLAIVLHQGPLRFVAYTVGAAILVTAVVRAPEVALETNPLQRQASALVTWGCLGLCALLAYLTRLAL